MSGQNLRTLGQRVRDGYKPDRSGQVAYSRTGKPDPFKADSYDARAWAAEVRRLAELQQTPRGAVVYAGDTPAVLRTLGAPDREMVMPAHVVHKATRADVKNHYVSVDTLADLPHLLADPVAVMSSKTEPDALVALIAATDTRGAPVIVAVHLRSRHEFAEVNKIASVYGKEG